MSPTDAQLARLMAPIEGGMQRQREILEEHLRERSDAVSDMTGHVTRFGGKQLRPALVLLVGEATGRTSPEHPSVAAIVELIHLATLVHDDVLDSAEVRRRVACVHQRWDNQVAVLLGDFLYARAFALSTELSSRLASQTLALTTQKICVGEIDQAQSRYDFHMEEDRYEAIAGAKTAALYSAACELGARYPDGHDELGHQMAKYGWEIGLAFQIVDDCLDLVGDPEVVGKSVGNDVEDGKVTLPVLYTYRHADEETRAAISDAYTLPGVEKRTERLRSLCDLEPGIEYAFSRAESLTRRAHGRLGGLEDSPAKDALAEFGGFVLQRRW